MASLNRRRSLWTAARGRVVLGALIAAAVAVGCRAAGVFLDLPAEQAEPARGSSIPEADRQQALWPVQFAADTAQSRPGIETSLDADSALALLPRDHAGNIDWVAALRDEVIQPRSGLPGVAPPVALTGFQFDFRFKGPAPMFDAYFPHSAHVEWLNCQSCHPQIFPYRNEPITMQAINRGEACGRCHGKVAFPTTTCERCHREMSMPEGRLSPEFIGNIVFTRTVDPAARSDPNRSAYGPANFPHWVHRIRYRCMACHPALFESRAGAATMTMDSMKQGKTCGSCHDGRAAFGLLECNRCHPAVNVGGDTGP